MCYRTKSRRTFERPLRPATDAVDYFFRIKNNDRAVTRTQLVRFAFENSSVHVEITRYIPISRNRRFYTIEPTRSSNVRSKKLKKIVSINKFFFFCRGNGFTRVRWRTGETTRCQQVDEIGCPVHLAATFNLSSPISLQTVTRWESIGASGNFYRKAFNETKGSISFGRLYRKRANYLVIARYLTAKHEPKSFAGFLFDHEKSIFPFNVYRNGETPRRKRSRLFGRDELYLLGLHDPIEGLLTVSRAYAEFNRSIISRPLTTGRMDQWPGTMFPISGAINNR